MDGEGSTSASAWVARSRYWAWKLGGPSAAKPYPAARTRTRFTMVPTRASLQEVAMAICEIAAAPRARAHHQVGAPMARNAAAVRTSAAASSQSTPARTPIGSVSWETSAHPKPLATPRRWMSPWPASTATSNQRSVVVMEIISLMSAFVGAWVFERRESLVRGGRQELAIACKMFSRIARRAGKAAASTPTTPEASSITRMSVQGMARVFRPCETDHAAARPRGRGRGRCRGRRRTRRWRRPRW